MSAGKDLFVHFNDMLDAIHELEQYASDPFEDAIRKRLIERGFEILGEAARRIPREAQPDYPHIPFPDLISMRNVIAHEYEVIELPRLIETIRLDLPPLKASLLAIVTRKET